MVNLRPVTKRNLDLHPVCNITPSQGEGRARVCPAVVKSINLMGNAKCVAPSLFSAARVCKQRRYRVGLIGPRNAWQRPDPPAMRAADIAVSAEMPQRMVRRLPRRSCRCRPNMHVESGTHRCDLVASTAAACTSEGGGAAKWMTSCQSTVRRSGWYHRSEDEVPR